MPTIQERINAAAPGTDVLVPTGTYPEAVNVNKQVNLKGQGGTVVLDKKQLQVTAPGATVTDFTVDGYDSGEPLYHNNNVPGGRAGGQWDTAGVKVTADNVTMTRVSGNNCGGTGIGIGGQDQPRVWRRGVKLIDCGAFNNGRNGLAANVCSGLTITRFTNKQNNRRKMVMEWESSQKFFICEDVLVDGGLWSDNWGPGQWFDYQCRRITVKRAEFARNTPWNTTSAWAAPGSNVEISEGPVLFDECWFHDSAPASKGLGLLECANVTLRRCKFDGQTLYLRDNTDRPPYRLGALCPRNPNGSWGAPVRNPIILEDNEVFNCSFPKHPNIDERRTITMAHAGPPSSWSTTTPPVDPPVDPPTPTQPRKAIKVEDIHRVTYDDGTTTILGSILGIVVTLAILLSTSGCGHNNPPSPPDVAGGSALAVNLQLKEFVLEMEPFLPADPAVKAFVRAAEKALDRQTTYIEQDNAADAAQAVHLSTAREQLAKVPDQIALAKAEVYASTDYVLGWYAKRLIGALIICGLVGFILLKVAGSSGILLQVGKVLYGVGVGWPWKATTWVVTVVFVRPIKKLFGQKGT